MQLSKLPAWCWIVAVLWILLVFLPAPWMNNSTYTAYAAGLQATGLVVALIVGFATLFADGRDRRVDRVYALHQEFTTGELDQTRRRLGYHLLLAAPPGQKYGRISRLEVLQNTSLNKYTNSELSAIAEPFNDLDLILGFFERAYLVQAAGSADDPSFAALVGGHASWWNCAIIDDGDRSRYGLMQLGLWADEFAMKNAHKYPFLATWGEDQERDFGSRRPWVNDRPPPAGDGEARLG